MKMLSYTGLSDGKTKAFKAHCVQIQIINENHLKNMFSNWCHSLIINCVICIELCNQFVSWNYNVLEATYVYYGQ